MAASALISRSAVEPLSLHEVKEHLRVIGGDEDLLIASLIPVAREMAEMETRRALVSQVWRDRYALAPETLTLRRWPVQSISAIRVGGELIDLADVSVELGDNAAVSSLLWRGKGVEVTYVAGYGDHAADVPASLRQWMLLQIGAMYADRQAHVVARSEGVAVNPHVAGLLDPYRVWSYSQ